MHVSYLETVQDLQEADVTGINRFECRHVDHYSYRHPPAVYKSSISAPAISFTEYMKIVSYCV